MRITALMTLILGYYLGLSQGFSKTGTEDLYLYKGTVLYKDGNGFIADVQKNFDEISVLQRYDEIFLRVIRQKENKSEQPLTVNSGVQAKITDTIIRHVSHFLLDTITYGRTKEYKKQGQSLQGNSLAYFLEQDDKLSVGETFYFNKYGVVMSNFLVEEFGMVVLGVERNFNFDNMGKSEEADDDDEISVVETGDIHSPYKVKVPEALKNISYHKTSSYEGRQIADNYKSGHSQFFAIINEQTKDTSFILGSMHSTESAFWNKKIDQPEILQRLYSCSALYFESMYDPAIVSEDSTTQYRSLEDELTPQQKAFFRHQYNTYLKNSGIAYNDLITLHPLVIENIFTNVFFEEKNVVLEDILAASLQKEFIKKSRIDFDFKELDTKEEITNVDNFRGKHYSPTLLMNDLKVMQTDLKSVWRDYEDGDIENLVEAVKNKYGQSYYNILIMQRNQNWLPRMIEGMKKEKCFFIVGAAHLGGTKGLLTLLRDKGYTILPLKWLN